MPECNPNASGTESQMCGRGICYSVCVYVAVRSAFLPYFECVGPGRPESDTGGPSSCVPIFRVLFLPYFEHDRAVFLPYFECVAPGRPRLDTGGLSSCLPLFRVVFLPYFEHV